MRVTVKTSLLVVVALLTALIAGLSTISMLRMQSMNTASTDVATNWLPSIQALDDIKYQITLYRLQGARHVLSTDEAAMAKLDSQLKDTMGAIARSFATYEPLISSEEERGIWKSFREAWPNYVTLQEKALVASRKNENEAAGKIFVETAQLFNDALAVLDRDIRLNTDSAAAATRLVESSYVSARNTIVVVSVIALSIAGLAAAFVVLGVTSPLNRLTLAMGEVSRGRLDVEIPSIDRKNEIGDMARTLVVFRDGLAETERLRREQADREAAAARHLVEERHAIADRFMATMGALSRSFVKSSGEVADAARNLSATAEETSRQAHRCPRPPRRPPPTSRRSPPPPRRCRPRSVRSTTRCISRPVSPRPPPVRPLRPRRTSARSPRRPRRSATWSI